MENEIYLRKKETRKRNYSAKLRREDEIVEEVYYDISYY